MKSKKLTIGGLTASLLLGLAVASFAGIGIPGNSSNIGTEAGVDIVASETAKTAAANFNYNSVQLAQVGTEAGYDPARMSTDRGFLNTGTPSEQVAEKCLINNANIHSC